MSTRRKKERQESQLRDVEILQRLGLTESPITQLGGLVNILTSIQRPQEFQQEIGLKERGLDLQQQQMEAGVQDNALGRMLQQAGLDLQKENMAQDFGFKSQGMEMQGQSLENQKAKNEAIMRHYDQANVQQGQQLQMSALMRLLEMLGNPDISAMFNREMLGGLAAKQGFEGLLNPQTSQGGGMQTGPGDNVNMLNDAVKTARAKIGK